jgi:hypothetical protein
MIKVDTAPIRYYSQLDEDHFFMWAKKIPCVKSIEGGFLHIASKQLSEPDLRDLIALMYRYKLPMKQLAVFCDEGNKHWLKKRSMYWYRRIFGI